MTSESPLQRFANSGYGARTERKGNSLLPAPGVCYIVQYFHGNHGFRSFRRFILERVNIVYISVKNLLGFDRKEPGDFTLSRFVIILDIQFVCQAAAGGSAVLMSFAVGVSG